jgi:hypothetical protein
LFGLFHDFVSHKVSVLTAPSPGPDTKQVIYKTL